MRDWNWGRNEEHRVLADGKYDVSNCAFVQFRNEYTDLSEEEQKEANNFIESYPDAVIASAYETHHTILLSESPPVINPMVDGTGFNHGCTAIIEVDRPMKILIVAQND